MWNCLRGTLIITRGVLDITLNLMGAIFAQLYELRGYERVQGERREKLEKLAGDNQPHEIFVGGDENSARTTFGNIIIPSRDGEFTEEEAEAVFLHEVGHVRDKLTYKLILLFLITGVIPAAFLMREVKDTLINLLPSLLLALTVTTLLGLVWAMTSFKLWNHRYEYRADEHAASRGYSTEIISALNTKEKVGTNPVRRLFYPSSESRIEKVSQRED